MLVDSLASSAKNTVVQLDNIHTTALETSRTSQQILSEQQEASEAARALLEQQLEAKRQLGDLQVSSPCSSMCTPPSTSFAFLASCTK